jgi:hypothetical protein
MFIRKRCEETNCFRYAIYGHRIGNSVRIKYCADHLKDGMISFDSCKNCIYSSYNRRIPNNKYLCSSCYVVLNPDSEYAKNYKKPIRKEPLIRDIFKDMSIINWDICDKIIDNTCCTRRPDYFKDFITHSIILEIDENQHDNYDMPCEIKREYSLYNGLADRPLIFIRFNPDSYICNNTEYESVFYVENNCLKINEFECKKRLLFVNYVLEYYKDYDNVLKLLNTKCKYPDKRIGEVKLFYDGKYTIPKLFIKRFMKLYKKKYG